MINNEDAERRIEQINNHLCKTPQQVTDYINNALLSIYKPGDIEHTILTQGEDVNISITGMRITISGKYRGSEVVVKSGGGNG